MWSHPTKLSGELPRGWRYPVAKTHSDTISLWGAAHQWAKCAKCCFSANTSRVAPEGVGSSPQNYQGNCHGGGDTFLKRPHSNTISLWGAAHQWVKCAKCHFCAKSHFLVNTPRLAPEGVGSSLPNCQGSYHGDRGTFWQRPHYNTISLCRAAHQWVNCAKCCFFGKHPWSSPCRSGLISTKLSEELPWGWDTFWQKPLYNTISLWGAAHQWVNCAKWHFFVLNPIFWINTPWVAPEGVDSSPPNCSGSCPVLRYPLSKIPFWYYQPVQSCLPVSKMCQMLFL